MYCIHEVNFTTLTVENKLHVGEDLSHRVEFVLPNPIYHVRKGRSEDFAEYDLFLGITVALRKEEIKGNVKIKIDPEDGG